LFPAFGAEEVPGAHDQHAAAARGEALQSLLQLDPDGALARGRVLGR
jgi:hypothetical protein